METKAVKIIRKHLGNDQVSNIFNDNEPLWDDIVSAVTEALNIGLEGKVEKCESLNCEDFKLDDNDYCGYHMMKLRIKSK